jgi:hypothetical protein
VRRLETRLLVRDPNGSVFPAFSITVSVSATKLEPTANTRQRSLPQRQRNDACEA